MNKTYIPALISLVLLATLHFCAKSFGWYTLFFGFDIIMHIVGGVSLALSFYWFIVTFFPKHKPTFWQLVMLVFIAGAIWEVFEAIYNIAGYPVGTLTYYVDTAKDLTDDIFGAMVASYYIFKK